MRRYILHFGNLGGLFIVPKNGVYGATRSFIRHFTKSLQAELRGTNTSISLLSSGSFKTTLLEPEEVARQAIDGMFKNKKEIIPGRMNRLFVRLNSLLPTFIKELILQENLNNVYRIIKITNSGNTSFRLR